MQDTIRHKVLVENDTLKPVLDTIIDHQKADTLKIVAHAKEYSLSGLKISDTASLCFRGVVADVTFFDSISFIKTLDTRIADRFPFSFTENNIALMNKKREAIIKTLKDGSELPSQPYQSDWIVPIIIFSLFLFALVKAFPGSFFRNMLRFLLLRGINENSSRDMSVLFQWQSTLLNFASFITISLFGYLMMKHYEIPVIIVNGFITWLIGFGFIAAMVTARHFVCNITGNFSGQTELFREYIISIYHVYRVAGIISLMLAIFVLYTTFLPANTYFITGFIVAGILYLLRVIRLLFIFINRHVSIFYLILYLCALEILPVVIIVKYVTGLV